MTEFELKLEIPVDKLSSLEAATAHWPRPRQRLQARYFDTARGDLARHGIGLRLRKEGRQWWQTAKAPGRGMLERLEHNAGLGLTPAGAEPALVLARHAATPLAAPLAEALAMDDLNVTPATLEQVFASDIRRLTHTQRTGTSQVELALDSGRLLAGDRVLNVNELEIELKQGRPIDAVRLAARWCMRHGLWLSTVTKAAKGKRLAAGLVFGPAVGARPPEFASGADGLSVTRSVLLCCLAQVLGNASEIAAGSHEADHVHQLRVGLRRLRTALRELRGLADGLDDTWEPVLVELFRTLGLHRDQSFLDETMVARLQAAGAPAIEAAPPAQVPDPVAAVRAGAVQKVLLELLAFCHDDTPAPPGAAVGPKATRKHLRKRLDRLHRKVVREGAQFMALGEEQQHDVRKRAKRLRYLVEFIGPLFDADRAHAFIDGLKPVQAALGDYNDELVALAAYRALTPCEPTAWFAVGWLSARREHNAQVCAQALADFAKVPPFWS